MLHNYLAAAIREKMDLVLIQQEVREVYKRREEDRNRKLEEDHS